MFEQMVDNLQHRGEVERRHGWRAVPKRRIVTESHLRDAVAGVVHCVDLSPSVATRRGRSSGPADRRCRARTKPTATARSAQKSRAYEGYAKRTMEQALAVTRKPHTHRIASGQNVSGTEFSKWRCGTVSE